MSTTTQVTVQFVNDPKPGGKKGSIKTTDGAYYGVWADKLHEFKPGGVYEVEYDESQFQGKTYRNINTSKGVKLIQEAAPKTNGAAGPVHSNNNNFRNPEQMFVEALMVTGIEQKLVPFTEDGVTGAGLMLQTAWQRLWGSNE
jgi:hypothetical protein